MKINYNATAMLAINQLNKNDANASASTNRLSSGYKINRAKDNPSGYAMSRKMRAQLDGLSQAKDNTDTGVSIIKAVDGALSEVHNMLQRMNELAIQSANGIYSDGDRELVDEEVQKLKAEIQRISETFEFNGQKLLNGSFQLKGYVTNELSVKVAGYNDRMRVGEYTFDLSGFKNGTALTRQIDGTDYTVKTFELYDQNGYFIPENVNDLWKKKVTVPADPSVDPPTQPAILDPETDSTKRQEGLGYLDATGKWTALPKDWNKTVEVENTTNAATIVTVTGPDGSNITPLYISDAGGTTLTLKGPDGFEIKLDIAKEFIEHSDQNNAVKINLTGLGAMTIQVGANEGQEMDLEIPDTGLKGLGIDMIKTSTMQDSLTAITRVGVAINRLSAIRSKLGAYQNRMESIVTSNEINHENMTAAYSGILDTDMAEEYTRYSTYQVLSQASTSVLAQANQRPAQVLQLLQ